MALENKTVAEINEAIINQIEAQINQTIPLLPISVTRILSKILAGVFIILYKVAQKLFLDIFVSTASFQETTIYGKKVTPLIEWGVLIGVGQPQSAVQAELELEIIVNSPGETLPSGTQFISSITGLIYITQQDYLLTAGPDTIEVICTTGGAQGNLEVSQILSLANTLGIIENDADITGIVTTGVDAEAESAYRQRVVERFQIQPQGGALADYRIWSSEVPGVLQTYIYTGDPGNVLVYVSGDSDIYTDRIPDAALLLLVGAACTYDPVTLLATRKPVTAIIDPDGDETYGNVLPISVKSFDVIIFDLAGDDLADLKGQIREALDVLFIDKEPYILGLSVLPTKNIISQVRVSGVINDVVNANNGDFTSAVLYEKDTYLAVAHATTPYLTIYKRSGDVFTKLLDPSTLPTGIGYGCIFSSDGNYMVLAHFTTPYVTIYKRSGDVFTKLSDPSTLPTGIGLNCAFSTDGTYLCVAHATSPYITIYKRAGDVFTKLSDPSTLPTGTGTGCAFSTDGTYLCIAHSTSPYLTIYKRAGDVFTKLSDPSTLPTGDGYNCAFSTDGTYLCIAHFTSPYITIYKRAGDVFTKLADPSTLPTGIGRGVTFSIDGAYLTVAHTTSPYITIYKRSGDVFTKLPDPSTLPTGEGNNCMFSTGGSVITHTLEEGQLTKLDLLNYEDS